MAHIGDRPSPACRPSAILDVVGIDGAHVAIYTSALAFSLNAFGKLICYWRAGNLKWPCAATLGRRRHYRCGDRLLKWQAGRRRQALVSVCACSDRGLVSPCYPRAVDGNLPTS